MNNRKCYFAAANGFGGFKSNFTSVFSSKLLDKLFVIKGGPGTGKSTLMRRIEENYRDKMDTSTILCSSDTASVDGILIRHNGVTLGMVDGTSPHILEPKYPGAVEVIVNLGDGFDTEGLRRRKNEIIDISESKKREYEKAYDMLAIAGDISKHIRCYFSDSIKYNEAENIIYSDFEAKESSVFNCKISPFFVGAFCKNGYTRISEFSENRRRVAIRGDGLSEYFLLSHIAKILTERSIPFELFPSAFSDDMPDMICTCDAVYYASDEYAEAVDSSAFFDKGNEYIDALEMYKRCLEMSRKSFERASEYHFKLEEIYSKLMRFEENEKKYIDIVNRIDGIFTNNVD